LVTTLDSSVKRGPGPALKTTERTAILTVDRVLETLNDQSPQETLVRDLAFAEVASDPRKLRRG
jgi:hypothetical protein